jgi:hypothetical protein
LKAEKLELEARLAKMAENFIDPGIELDDVKLPYVVPKGVKILSSIIDNFLVNSKCSTEK